MQEEIIDEGLSEEDGLNNLTTGVLVALGNQIALEIIQNKGKLDLGTYGFVHTGGISKKHQEQLGKEVYSFWSQLDLLVSIVRNKNTGSAQYIHSPRADGKYDYGSTKRIELNVTPEDMQKLADEVTRYGDDVTGNDVYFKLYYLFHSPLLHELRHAFDDMRTNGMIFQDKKALKFRDKYSHMGSEPADAEDPIAFKQQRGKAYVQQPHEIWARASQAMHNLRYTKGIAELGDDVEMIPLRDVVSEFRYNFKYWRNISEKARRRLIKAVANAWQEAYADLKNKELSETTLRCQINEELRSSIRVVLAKFLGL